VPTTVASASLRKEGFALDTLKGLVALLMIPLFVLNALGGVVAAIWLAILGEWGTIGIGLAVLVVGPFAIGLLLLPQMLFAGIGSFWQSSRSAMLITMILSNIYTSVLLGFCCLYVLAFFVSNATSASLTPSLLWAYAVGTGPWAYLLSKEPDSSVGSTIATFFADLAFLVVIGLFLFAREQASYAVAIFSGMLGLSCLIQIGVGWSLLRSGEYE